ncbi:hypothetical protein NEICINOT_04221 [Neisseria cinerea ATCC 14685]|uniref:Uncharacterized protein n=1 Tax=Neisseria cinerea ATCC 14685 TaxID=546262 RepID=D0W3I1_NEICI|nr:hypothetical protein NEICINOT_04221 [Neisseria cinerea ATCC 14685]
MIENNLSEYLYRFPGFSVVLLLEKHFRHKLLAISKPVILKF